MTEKTQNKDTINAEKHRIKPKLYFALAEDTPQVWLRMSREEAIKRMAKAMCSNYGINHCENCGFSNEKRLCKANCEAHYEVAEAALDALLGD